MRDEGQANGPVKADHYYKSHRQLQKLKSLLPADAVEDLAGEVIRRLSERHAAHPADLPSSDQIDHLCFALLAEDHEAGATFIADARTAGASIDAIYLQYLSPAARKLGDWWEDSLVSFTDVTLATSRMYAIMNALRHEMPRRTSSVPKSAIFASVPGDDHTLGVRMAADLFRKEGWDIILKTDEDHDSLVSYIAETDVPIVGFSAGGRHSLQALSRLVVAVRIKKPRNLLLVGGHIVEEAPSAIRLLGVDGVLADIETARVLMDDLVHQLNS